MKTKLLAVVLSLAAFSAFADEEGHYELTTTQDYVEGGWTQSEQSCTTETFAGGSRQVCRSSFGQQRWVNSHYETRQTWVWVQTPSRRFNPSGWNRSWVW